VSSINTVDTCLPISLTPPFSDINDLNYHVLCTNIGPRRSLLRLVEIFNGADDSSTFAPGKSYILSLRSGIPFKVNTTGVSYQYRPRCVYETDVCSPADSIVSKCQERPVIADDDIDEDGYVEAIRRVYVLLPGQTINSCKTNNVCCPYITTSTATGICRFFNKSLTHGDPWVHHHGDDHHGHDDHHHNNNDHHNDGDNDADDHHHDNDHHHHDDGDNDADDHHHHHKNEVKKEEEIKPAELTHHSKKIQQIVDGIRNIALGKSNMIEVEPPKN